MHRQPVLTFIRFLQFVYVGKKNTKIKAISKWSKVPESIWNIKQTPPTGLFPEALYNTALCLQNHVWGQRIKSHKKKKSQNYPLNPQA